MAMGMFRGKAFVRTPDGMVHGLDDRDLIGCLGKPLCEVGGAKEVESVVEADACHNAGCRELFDFYGLDVGAQPPPRTVSCDHCGYPNPPDALNCRNCNHPTRDT